MSIPELTEPVPQPLSSAGKILSARREEWGLSVAEVASNLNLGADTIEALEADDYDSLPGTTFIKGYMRSYARLLKLDVEGLMDSIDLQPERITEIPSSRAALKQKGKTRSREKTRRSGRRFFKWLFILVLLLVLVVFGVTQLPKLGIESVSDLVGLPGLQSEKDENQLIIPEATIEPSAEPANQPKGALIRIE